MAKKKIKEIVTEELVQFLPDNGLELYNVEFVKEGRDWFLRVYIDRAEGTEGGNIGTDDCEKVSGFLSKRLDESDPIEQNYYLEVSSPGMDRTLGKEADFAKFAGKPVDVVLYQAINGKKNLAGTLKGLQNGNIVIIDEQGNEIEIRKEQAAKTKLAVVF